MRCASDRGPRAGTGNRTDPLPDVALCRRAGIFRRAVPQLGQAGQQNGRVPESLHDRHRHIPEGIQKRSAAWEFGNEFNLHADLPQYAQRHPQADPPDWRDVFGTEDPDWRIRGNDILYAYRTFTRIVRRLDPDRRMLLSGNAILRETQYNQYTRDRMTIDDTKQYRKISRILNPGPIETVSEHVYQHGRQFADLGKVSLDEQIAIAVETARSLGKVYVMGEFGAIRGSREEYVPFFEAFLKAGVRLFPVLEFLAARQHRAKLHADRTRPLHF